ncbi:SDR family NAD(P)-dependent oxidoreductase [Salinibacterium sp. GXW1014]|uniref:SDR family NAD(P)-dependent oxidoreductase n=1 Tax=Salinibacterium sp. GXW1014 TaxID=3377838 RepID=UPI00383A08D4
MTDLTNTVAVVTGAGTGIGEAIARALATAGARVAVTNRSPEPATAVRDDIVAQGGDAIALRLDISSRDSIAEGLDAVISQYGRIDVMVNNAGISGEIPFMDVTGDDWDRMLDTNGLGTLMCMQEVAKRMAPDGGKIINLTSITGRQANPTFAHYSASKFAINSLIQSGARALASRNITVMGLAPGIVATPLWNGVVADDEARAAKMAAYEKRILLRRVSVSDDLAPAAVFLASSGADYMTGHVMTVDGGLVLV